MVDLVVRNIGQLATPQGTSARCGKHQSELSFLSHAAIAVEGGVITQVGFSHEMPAARRTVDAEGALVTPGLIDCHTHLVFGGWRHAEFGLKQKGVPYLEILRQGGGILSTVESTRVASPESLYKKSAAILREMSHYGVTTCEAKSGYGLDLENEDKLLAVAQRLATLGIADIVLTFMGAHAVPAEYRDNREDYIDLVCNKMLPILSSRYPVKFCDIFCETNAFSVEESRRILHIAKTLGLGLKIHADEIDAIGGSTLAAELGAVSAEHLISASSIDIRKMAESGVIGVLLPATSFYLGKPYAQAKEMLASGMAVAIASDFNPGSSPNCNLQLAMNISCLKYGLIPAQVLTAVTLNAAAALGLAEATGSIEVGKRADFVIWNADHLDYIFYRFGSNLAQKVFYRGKEITNAQDRGMYSQLQ